MLKTKVLFIAFSAALILGFMMSIAGSFLPRRYGGFLGATRNLSSGNSSDSVLNMDRFPALIGFRRSQNIGGDVGAKDYDYVSTVLSSLGNKELADLYRLKGVIIYSGAAGLNSAVIQNVHTQETRAYHLNELLPDGSRLVDIRQDSVILEYDGVRRWLGIGGERRSSPNGDEMIEAYRKIGNNEYILKPYSVFKGDVDQVLDFSMKLYSNDGQIKGIQISDVKDNSLARGLGLQNDDVLEEVNGKILDSLFNCIKACFDAQSSDEVQLKILRGNRYIHLTYDLLWEARGGWAPVEVINTKAVMSLLADRANAHLF